MITSGGSNISISNCSHCDDHPVEGSRDRCKPRLLINFYEVSQGGKDEATDAD